MVLSDSKYGAVTRGLRPRWGRALAFHSAFSSLSPQRETESLDTSASASLGASAADLVELQWN
jgi:hypothetical protein